PFFQINDRYRAMFSLGFYTIKDRHTDTLSLPGVKEKLPRCNTDSLFTPGKFLFNTRQRKSISMTILDRIEPEGEHCPVSVVDLEKKVRENFRLRSKSCDQEGRGSKQTERLP
ncbi:MAG: hypothetical protein KJ985_06975, partial [Proteobacteria bacterium]|nr:hypothetical protein [Pseudomonadota bacterium]